MKKDSKLDREIRRLIVVMNNASVAFHPPFDLSVYKSIKETNPKGFEAFIEYTKLTDDWLKSLKTIAKWSSERINEFVAFVEEH